VLGFFKQSSRGEVEALSATSDSASVWISTGVRFDLDDSGLPTQWIRVTVMFDRSTGRWNLQIDGLRVLAGLRAIPGASANSTLWLYGDESRPSYFDDVLLSADDPNHLERLVTVQNEQRRIAQLRAATSSAPQMVTQTEQDSQLRRAQPNLTAVAQKPVAPELRTWEATFNNGETSQSSGPISNVYETETRFMAFAPRRDANGKALPMTLTISADAELKPGTDLHKLRWIVGENVAAPNEIGDIMAAGDFSTGLVQTVTFSSEWADKPTLTYVWGDGTSDDIHKILKITKGLTPAVSGTGNALGH
jgi:hypothetical protein